MKVYLAKKNMLKKIFPIIFIIAFVAIFSYIKWGEFFQYQEKQEKIVEQKIITQWKLENFSVEKIRELDDTGFYYTPYKPLLTKIVEKIKNAKKRVFVEVYMLTEKRIKEALVKAHKRWIDIKIVIEHSPYLAVNLNQKHFKQLQEKWVNIVWSNAKNYALNHSKIMLIDDELILSSGNFTYSTFAHNRDLFLITRDKNIVNIFTKIFNKDFEGERFQIYDDSIILSPDYSRIKFEKMIMWAEKNIKIYAQYLKDKKLFNIIQKKVKQWIKVEIILSKNWYKEYVKEKVGSAGLQTLQVSVINNKAKMHSKAIAIDDKYLFIGSVNFSSPSMDSNREMWLLLTNKKILEKFLEVFKKDKK